MAVLREREHAFTIRTHFGRVPIRGPVIERGGLVLHRSPIRPGWTVTHARTGNTFCAGIWGGRLYTLPGAGFLLHRLLLARGGWEDVACWADLPPRLRAELADAIEAADRFDARCAGLLDGVPL